MWVRREAARLNSCDFSLWAGPGGCPCQPTSCQQVTLSTHLANVCLTICVYLCASEFTLYPSTCLHVNVSAHTSQKPGSFHTCAHLFTLSVLVHLILATLFTSTLPVRSCVSLSTSVQIRPHLSTPVHTCLHRTTLSAPAPVVRSQCTHFSHCPRHSTPVVSVNTVRTRPLLCIPVNICSHPATLATPVHTCAHLSPSALFC